jgi:hypothetical protein
MRSKFEKTNVKKPYATEDPRERNDDHELEETTYQEEVVEDEDYDGLDDDDLDEDSDDVEYDEEEEL